MTPRIADVNRIYIKDNHLHCWCCFWHLQSLDGAEIKAVTLCSSDTCPICEYPKAELQLAMAILSDVQAK